MRILNILMISKGMPQIVHTFPVLDEDYSNVTIEEAEKALCHIIFGPECDEEELEREFFEVIDYAYKTGVSKLTGPTYHLLWSEIPD
jgi:hypothetical protein